MSFNEEWRLTIKPSRSLLALITALHVLALLVPLFVTELPVWTRSLLTILIILSWCYYSALHSGLWPGKAIAQLTWREFDGWELSTDQGEHFSLILQNSSFSSLIASVLNFRSRCGQHFTIVILPDNANPACRRHLRRRMKGRELRPTNY